MAETVRVIAEVRALPGQEEALKSLLIELVEPSRSEAGCLRYELLQSSVTPTAFVFVEEWESEELETKHLRSAHIEEAFLEGQSLLAAPPAIHRYRQLA